MQYNSQDTRCSCRSWQTSSLRSRCAASKFIFVHVSIFFLAWFLKNFVLSYLSHDTGTSDIRVCIYKPTARPVHLDVVQWGRASPADNDAHTTVWRHTTYRRHRTEMDLVLGVQVWVLVAVQTHARHYGGVIGGVLSSKCAEKRHSGGDREKHAGNKHKRGEQDGGSTRHTTDETTHNKSEKQWKFRQIHRSPRTNAQPLAHVMSTLHCLSEKLQWCKVRYSFQISSFVQSCVDRGIAAKTAALSRSGKRKPLSRAHGLRHRAQRFHCMPDASSVHDMAFAWPSLHIRIIMTICKRKHTWIWHWRGSRRKKEKKEKHSPSSICSFRSAACAIYLWRTLSLSARGVPCAAQRKSWQDPNQDWNFTC
jgi:hypothetical protein